MPNNRIKFVFKPIRTMKSFLVESSYYSVEFFEGEALIGGGFFVNVSTVHQLQELIVVQVLVDLLANGLQLLEVDHSSSVGVEKSEYLLKSVFCLGFAHFRANEIQEFVEINGSVLVSQAVDEGEDEGVSLVEAEFFEYLVDFCWVDGSAAIFVKDFECGFEFFVVLCVESVFPGERGGRFAGCGWLLCFGGSAHVVAVKDINEKP